MSETKDNDKRWYGEERRKSARRQGDPAVPCSPETGGAVFSSLKKKLLIYFVIISFVSLVVGLEMIWEIAEPALIERLSAGIADRYGETQPGLLASSGIFDPLKELQLRMLILLAVVAVSIAVTLVIFIRDIVNPLESMVIAAKQIRDGNLSATVPVKTKDEIGQMGEIFNELAVNFQEVLLFVGSAGGDLSGILSELEDYKSKQADGKSGFDEKLHLMSDKVNEIKEMVRAFDYYHASYDGNYVRGEELGAEP